MDRILFLDSKVIPLRNWPDQFNWLGMDAPPGYCHFGGLVADYLPGEIKRSS